ncbi:MAG: hypothetical protein GWN86_06875 [Desulfobacterales bacterium]|nr:hypothetical protein [Desulfobacterales bacterium]
MAKNPLNDIIDRVDSRIVRLEKAASASTTDPLGAERLPIGQSLKRLEEFPSQARKAVIQKWTREEKQQAMDRLGGPRKMMEFLNK